MGELVTSLTCRAFCRARSMQEVIEAASCWLCNADAQRPEHGAQMGS